MVVLKGDPGTVGDDVEDAEGLGHDFRTDTVTREDSEFVCAAH